jgi:UDP-N-acetylglucosamine--N-acetylmuramyl-(pentapeptide) pyrophosphoryl-undecaprenol N-acetylglucosamine transferase
MLAGGGTGGHVYPLLAIVEALEGVEPHPLPANPVAAASRSRTAAEMPPPLGRPPSEQYEFHFIGSERSESRIVPQYAQESQLPIQFHQIDVRFSYRLPTPRNWGYYRAHILPLLGGRPFRQARAVLERVQPDLVLASGGYVSAPALWAARQLGIPYALLQLDAAVGLVNRHFAPQAARVYASTERAALSLRADCAERHVLVSGFPARRPRLERGAVLAQYGFDPARRLFTVMGGSLGTGAIAGLAAELVELLDTSAYADDIAVLFSAGERMDTARAIREAGTQRLQFAAVDYIGDSVSVLAASDFYLGRSGASTVAELIACGPQSLLIPDPQHHDRQQYLNAAELVRRGNGEVLEQREATGAGAAAWLQRVWDKPRVAGPETPAAEVIASDIRRLL